MSNGYPSDWNKRRHEVYTRDNCRCQNCGVRGGDDTDTEIHAHHIVPKANGGTHNKSNLITLCKQCHSAVHGDVIAPTTMASSNSKNSVTIDSVRRWAEAVVNNHEEIDFITSDPGGMSFEHCAVCDGSDSLMMAEDFSSLTEPKVLKICPNCYSIYTFMTDSWMLSYSASDAEGTILSGEIWSQVVEDGVSEPAALEQYEAVWEWQNQARSRLGMYLLVSGSILFAIIFITVNLISAIAVATLASVAAQILSKRVDKQANQKLRDIQDTA